MNIYKENGAEHIFLKRMGREDTELWYEEVDFTQKQVLVIEWTHGNSPFTTMVLELEQQLLASLAHKVKIIVTKDGKLVDYKQYCELMNEC